MRRATVHLKTGGARYQLMCGAPVAGQANLFGGEDLLTPCTASILRTTCDACLASLTEQMRARRERRRKAHQHQQGAEA